MREQTEGGSDRVCLTRHSPPAGLSPRVPRMPQHSRALVLLLVALAVLSQSAEGARAKTAPAPPPPPPPPPSLLDAIKAVAVSAVAKLPSRAACLEACLKISGAALQLASSAASASHKAAAALTVRLDSACAGTAGRWIGPAFALTFRSRARLSLGNF